MDEWWVDGRWMNRWMEKGIDKWIKEWIMSDWSNE